MDPFEDTRPGGRSKSTKSKFNTRQRSCAAIHERQFGDFKCVQCGWQVSAEPSLAGVNNRNHCPYCLWSKHVDLRQPGDRLAACKGKMQPVGLAAKRLHKRYPPHQPGELMLVHQCAQCSGLSLNRLAADDYPAGLWQVFAASLRLAPDLTAAAQAAGIEVLGPAAEALVRARLFGERE